MENKDRHKDIWDKIDILSKLLAALIIPIVLGVVGNSYNTAIKDREIKGQFVQLSVDILKESPREDTKNLRTWAVQVINSYSGVVLPETTKQDLIEKIPIILPVTNTLGISYMVPGNIRNVTRIIISDTETSLQYTIQDILNSWATRDIIASYHYLIDRNGNVSQMVNEEYIAFHAQEYNDNSIGIGLMHIEGENYSESQINSLKQLLIDISERYDLSVEQIYPKFELIPGKSQDITSYIQSIKDDVKSVTGR